MLLLGEREGEGGQLTGDGWQRTMDVRGAMVHRPWSIVHRPNYQLSIINSPFSTFPFQLSPDGECAAVGATTTVLKQSALSLGSRLQFWGKMRCIWGRANLFGVKCAAFRVMQMCLERNALRLRPCRCVWSKMRCGCLATGQIEGNNISFTVGRQLEGAWIMVVSNIWLFLDWWKKKVK